MAKRTKKNRARVKARGSSKAGRPRKSGDRYPSGGLRPAGPNDIVVKRRRELLGDAKLDIAKASDPLDLAHARGWLTDAQYRAARTVERLYREARLGAPRMGSGGLHEVQPSLQIDARSFAIMPDDEIEALWDQVFCDEGDVTPDERAGNALTLWGRVMGGLDKSAQVEVFSVCIAGSWPQWMVYEARGKAVPPAWEARRTRLFMGLEQVRQVMRRERPASPSPAAREQGAPDRNRRARMVEERIVYVDEDGDPVPMVSEHGRPFEMARLTRRAG